MTIHWERDTSVSLPMRETQVLSMGVIRTGETWARQHGWQFKCLIITHSDSGSSSITDALTILGYKDVHHGITATPREYYHLSFCRALSFRVVLQHAPNTHSLGPKSSNVSVQVTGPS